MNDEEHRIFYVAMSRAKKKLFLQFDYLDINEQRKIKERYDVNILRILNLRTFKSNILLDYNLMIHKIYKRLKRKYIC